jgi:D-glycerate 3-kinase
LLWPDGLLTEAEFSRQWRDIRPAFLARLEAHRIPRVVAHELAGIYLPLAAWVHRRKGNDMLVVGVNGAQGSGKSTLCDLLGLSLAELHGHHVAGFSIDDLYKTRTERERLSREIHPLLITRGVPGTHDVELGLDTLRALASAGADTLTALPSFDKSLNDRRPISDWPQCRGRPDIVIFEGWCVGTAPQPDSALLEPVNELERVEDPDGAWRRHVNEQLKGEYAKLFQKLDGLIMLKVPGMGSVYEWRSLQERKLANRTASDQRSRLMDAAAIRRFIMHYERLTLHNLQDMPQRADLTLTLDEGHRFTQVRGHRPS